jgi:fermentation-respiration switch protein FrsA (DUF1100 family)
MHLWEAEHHVLVFESSSTVGVPDFLGAVAYARKHTPSARLGAFGYGVGGAICIMGSARAPEIETVVADSAFATNYQALLVALHQTHGKWPRLIIRLLSWATSQVLWLHTGYRLRHVEPLQDIKRLAPRPLLLIQGLDDANTCPRDAQLLYQAAGKPKALWLLPKAEHVPSNPAYVARVTKFFGSHLKMPRSTRKHNNSYTPI